MYKKTIKLISNLANLGLIPGGYRRGRKAGRRRRQRRRNRRLGGQRRNGVEINKAEGGFKPLNACPLRFSGIDLYNRITLTSAGVYQWANNSKTLNIHDLLNINEEFESMKLTWYRYKICGIRVTFSYSAILGAGHVLTKLFIIGNTDTGVLDQKVNPQYSMKWDMSSVGVKNYNFNVNTSNTDSDYVEWLPGSASYNGFIRLYLDQASNCVVPTGTADQTLGDVKISVIFRVRLKDTADLVNTMKKKINENKNNNNYDEEDEKEENKGEEDREAKLKAQLELIKNELKSIQLNKGA
jgi:hypothetical protein